jgi:hypothetical protein
LQEGREHGMKITQQIFGVSDTDAAADSAIRASAQLVLVFGGTAQLSDQGTFLRLRKAFSNAILLGCSTAGEIFDTRVLDDSIVVTAVEFEHTGLRLAQTDISDMAQSGTAGEYLAAALPHEDLTHVLVLSDGLKVNGTALTNGLKAGLPEKVLVTGGLSGDGERFVRTLVCANSMPVEGKIAALGFYGDRLRVGFGSLGGWDPFGPERLITRAEGNVLYELDNQSALELYKKYLGPHAAGLPATGLLFPLALRSGDGTQGLVRTILAVSEADQSMTFAGDMPEGSYARLMKANFERLIDGAIGAARSCHEKLGDSPADLAILISCVGRKLVLKQRIEEEVEGVREVLGEHPVLAGFYSYGEISPHTPSARCELHNQTMTITTFAES